MKISYYAWMKGITVKQLIVEQIISSYVTLRGAKEQILLFDCNKYLEKQRVFDMLKAILDDKEMRFQRSSSLFVSSLNLFRRQTHQEGTNIITKIRDIRDG